jgi:hypothetical protein
MKSPIQTTTAVILVITVLGVAVLSVLSINSDEIIEWYREQTLESQVQKEYAIIVKKEDIVIPGDNEPCQCTIITVVAKGGKAEAMGFKEGDIPLRLSTCLSPILPRGTFLYLLSAHVSQKGAIVAVINRNDLKPGWPNSVRKVSLYQN